jgi:hypothetical protein
MGQMGPYGACHITGPAWEKPKVADYEIEVLLPKLKKKE